jgi:hypothetical protein
MSDVHRFRMAMAQHLGKPLTPEVAAAIEAAVFHVPDQAIDTGRFAPLQHGDFTIRAESFRAVLEELKPLHAAHWLETERYRHGLALNPDYEAMALRERLGRLLQLTVRREAHVVGHLRLFTGLSLHTQTVVADEDTLYIAPAHRGGFMVMALLRYAEAALVALHPGGLEIRTNSKVVNRADVLMRRMGYQHFANQFVKFIGGDHGHSS